MPAADKAAYAEKLMEIAARFDRLEADTVRRSLELVRQLKGEIAGALLDGGEFDAWRARTLVTNLERLVHDYEGQLSRLAGEAITRSHAAGAAWVTEPLMAAGIASLGAGFFVPTKAQLNVLLDFSADLVTHASAELISQITTQVRLAALGNKGTTDAMLAITRLLGGTAGKQVTPGGIAVRGERILRTEMNRAYNLSSFSQGEALAERLPGLTKRWMATGDARTRDSHLRIHVETASKPIPYHEPFIVGGAALMYPLDPAGPGRETIHCRCRMLSVLPEMGVTRTPRDRSVTRQINKRGGV